MTRKKFDRLSYSAVYQEIEPIIINLVAGAALADIVSLDVTPLSNLTITLDVSGAALTGLEVWMRGDSKGRAFLIGNDQLDGYGRTDASTDIATTPAGAACFVMLDCVGWASVTLKAKSAGAGKIVATFGGQ
ncbi:MAG: hypothetical protein ABW069_17565 [Duganella sp.]